MVLSNKAQNLSYIGIISINQVSGLKLMQRFLWFTYGKSYLHLLITNLDIRC